MSWCLEANADLDLGAALSAHVFGDATGGLAEAVLALGDAHRLVTPQFPNMSTLVMNLYYPQLPVGRGLTEGITVEELTAVEACFDAARTSLGRARPERTDTPDLVDQVAFSIDLVALLVRDARARLGTDGRLASVPSDERARLGDVLDALIERYRGLWLAHNRPGGLDDSVAWLHNVRSAYRSGQADPTWGGLPAPSTA